MDFAFLRDTLLPLLGGVPLTLKLAFMSVALGAVLAMLLALMRMSGSRARLAGAEPMCSSSAARRCSCRSS